MYAGKRSASVISDHLAQPTIVGKLCICPNVNGSKEKETKGKRINWDLITEFLRLNVKILGYMIDQFVHYVSEITCSYINRIDDWQSLSWEKLNIFL